MTGLVLVRTSLYVSVGLVFWMIAFVRSNAYKRRTGSSPWHIHPVVWGGMSVFAALLATLMSIVFVAIFGTVLSIFTWSPRLSGGRHRGDEELAGDYSEVGFSPVSEMPPAVVPSPLPRATALTAWLGDPSGRNELRYFDGSSFTEHVANGGVISSDPL